MNIERNKEGLDFEMVWARICSLTGWKRQGQLADYLKIKPASVAGAKQRGFIALEWVYKVAQGYSASTDWLATGEGPMERGKSGKESEWPPEGYVAIPRYDIEASAGGGALVHSEQIVDVLTFKSDWLKVSLGLSPTRAAVISVAGDSMEPHLADGDLILIDTAVNKVNNNGIYVIQYDDSLLVKRIQVKGDGTVIVKSDNPHYEPETFRGDAAERLKVVGRLVRRLVR